MFKMFTISDYLIQIRVRFSRSVTAKLTQVTSTFYELAETINAINFYILLS